MAKASLSIKRVEIVRANARIVAVIAISSALVAFSLVAARSLLSQRSYQSRIITEKNKALRQLKDNIEASKTLVNAYTAFVNESANVIGGNPGGSGDKDGDNAKIVLDALPSKYDFPALAASLEKILSNPGYKIDSITGTDDEINQFNTSSPSPTPVEIPFQIVVSGNYAAMQGLVGTLERSIRPFHLLTVELSGNDAAMKATITAKTYYQPEKNLNITTKEIR